MKAFVIAELNQQHLEPTTYACVDCATQCAQEIVVLVMGHDIREAVNEASLIQGVTEVIAVEHVALSHPVAEQLVPIIKAVTQNSDYVIAPASSFSKNILPRLAAVLDVGMVSDVIAVVAADTFKRPIYAGNATQTVKTHDATRVLSIRTTAFNRVGNQAAPAVITSRAYTPVAVATTFVSHQPAGGDLVDLTRARVVVAGGRALQSAENFSLLADLAERLGGALGASRAAVDAGYVSNDCQVGQTGKVVAPELYLAIGISGAIQHIAGMKDSKVIVAINKDASAPIFNIADYGLVGDLFTIVPALIAALEGEKL